jgi:hypothetical protein
MTSGASNWIRRSVDVPCTVDIAQTVESLHAHVELEGIEVGPGDAVLVHDAPTRVAYGEHIVCGRQATVTRAGLLGRVWTRLTSRFELTLLYEVSFSPEREASAVARRIR